MNRPATTHPLRISSRVRPVGARGRCACGHLRTPEIALQNRPNFRSNSTGKERDEETGYSYFGARYMDHELLTGWLSVDPMADKYPGISPYNYCMWNPLKLVDPDGNDWYEYTNEKTKKTEIKWTNHHSQNDLDKNNIKGKYLGVTVEDGKDYYSLFGSKEKLGTPSGNLVQDLDREVIKYARCMRMGEDIRGIGYGDFSNIYAYDNTKYLGISFSSNIHYGSELHYAGAAQVQVMVNATNMEGRLESTCPTERPLTGMGGGTPIVNGNRYNIEGRNGEAIVSFSYKTKAEAVAFAKKVSAMANRKIYPTLKQMRRVNGSFHQITKYD